MIDRHDPFGRAMGLRQVVDRLLTPFYWYNAGNERWFSLALSLVDKRAQLLPLDSTLQRVYDPYAFIRDAFTQRRLFQVYDGDIPEDRLPRDEADDEADIPEDEADVPADEPPPPAQAG